MINYIYTHNLYNFTLQDVVWISKLADFYLFPSDCELIQYCQTKTKISKGNWIEAYALGSLTMDEEVKGQALAVSMDGKVGEITTNIDLLCLNLVEERNEAFEKSKECDELKKENGELKEENGELKEENGELKEEIGELKEENGQLKKENGELKEKIFKLKSGGV